MADHAVTSVDSEKQKEMFELENKKKEAKQVRKNKLAALTRKMNKMRELMSDPANLEQVKENLQKYTEVLEEFDELHKQYQELLSKDECVTDTGQWYEPKRIVIEEFRTGADEWIKSCPVVAPPTEKEDEISPKDSISSVSRGSKSSRSSSSSARLVAQAERAALLAKAATMKERHALEEKEQLLSKEREEIRRQMETLNFEAELSATNAKLAVYAGAEEQVASTPADGMNAYFEERNLELANMDTLQQVALTTNMLEERIVRPKDRAKHVPLFQASSRQGELGDHIGHWLLQETPEVVGPAQRSQSALNLQADRATRGNAILKPIREKAIDHSDKVELSTEYRPLVDDLVISQADPMLPEQEQVRSLQDNVAPSNLIAILNRQNEITSMLLRQQQLSTLPPKRVTVFDGDILEFRSFMNSFEHNIESKTDNGQDRLFYLEQYTKGQARDLVKSCQHMDGDQGYLRAKRLLHEHFGNEYNISTAYIEKALSWPILKPEDPKALNEYALFLKGCCNAMTKLDYMEELNVASTLKALVMKLPFKFRDKWRTKAQEKLDGNSKITFADLVQFIEKQAKICSNPVFGDIQESVASRSKRPEVSKPMFRPKVSYAANVAAVTTPVTSNMDSDVKSPCLCCDGAHSLEHCSDFKKKTHREKLNLLQEKALCFGCLRTGHRSKDCHAGRLSCNICNRIHPSVLHINFQVKGETIKSAEPPENIKEVKSNVCRHNGAGNSKCALSILPVQVKSVKGNRIIQTYAFLDPGSSATFCTERLAQKLSLEGKPTTVLLKTMSQERPVKSTLVSGLEVSELEGNNFLPLPEVFTQRSMPVTKDDIPTQADLRKWPYISEVQLLQIDSGIDLLIGMNAANLMEPWQVINSQEDGPYAVRTLLGWVVNGPLGGCSKGVDKATVTANRISLVNLQELLVSQYNTDFNERVYDEKSEMSVDDKKFLNIANESVKVIEGHYCINLPFKADKVTMPNNCSRGVSAESFMRNQRWICGPEFLWSSEEDWPNEPIDRSQLCTDDPEVRKSVTVNSIMQTCEERPTDKLLNYFSDWLKLRVAVAWIMKVKDALRHLVQKRKDSKDDCKYQRATRINTRSVKISMKESITVEDLKGAENAILTYVQRQSFPQEISMLQEGASCVRKGSSIYRLDPMLDGGILRVGGRLRRSAMPEERKHPAILAKDHHVSTLILRHIHAQTGHGGRNHMLSQVRKTYWIVNANTAARKVLSHCVTCRKNRGKPGEQKMADLPGERLVTDLPPFTNVGLDYFGPFEVRRGRSMLKRYGVIFTCMTSRAVHLEVACSLTTDSCINAIRRFLCRRGPAQHMRSDHGTNLVGAERELREALQAIEHRKIQQTLRKEGVQWSFNSPTASHHGGFWERLIRMVRHVLCSVLKQQTLDDEGLTTVFCEVEAILNSRPITKVSDDPQDLEALTPNHILLYRTNPLLPPGVFSSSDLYHRRRWRQVQYIAELFWKRWLLEYLPLLQERQKWSRTRRNFVPGDIVLIADSNALRSSWLLGRVLEAKPDARGHVRVVKLQTKTSVLERPVSKICLLLEGDDCKVKP